MFFACKANVNRYIYENASEYNFVCPQCGESLEYQDNTLIIGELLNKKAKYESMSKIKLTQKLIATLPKPENKGYVLCDSLYSIP